MSKTATFTATARQGVYSGTATRIFASQNANPSATTNRYFAGYYGSNNYYEWQHYTFSTTSTTGELWDDIAAAKIEKIEVVVPLDTTGVNTSTYAFWIGYSDGRSTYLRTHRIDETSTDGLWLDNALCYKAGSAVSTREAYRVPVALSYTLDEPVDDSAVCDGSTMRMSITSLGLVKPEIIFGSVANTASAKRYYTAQSSASAVSLRVTYKDAQASVYDNGAWHEGSPWVYDNGIWHEAAGLYVYEDGVWHASN